jgi:hypothetical protein
LSAIYVKVKKMNAKLLMTSVVFAVFIFLTASALAQPLAYDQYPSGPDYPGLDPLDPNYPREEYPNYPTDPNYPGTQQGPVTDPISSGGNEGHPSNGPSSSEPLFAPSGSNTEALNYAEGESLSLQEVSSSGMMASGSGIGSADRSMTFMMTSGLQIWTRYNGMWTVDPASVFFWRSTSILSYNDQAQRVWSWEGYPRGRQVWRNLGYRMPGYFHGRFTGDERGWHRLAMWGSRSGWSNVLWIYVW